MDFYEQRVVGEERGDRIGFGCLQKSSKVKEILSY